MSGFKGMACSACGHDWLSRGASDERHCPKCGSPDIRPEGASRRTWPAVLGMLFGIAVVYFSFHPEHLPRSGGDLNRLLERVRAWFGSGKRPTPRGNAPAPTAAANGADLQLDLSVPWPANPELARFDLPGLSAEINRAIAARDHATAEACLKELIRRDPRDVQPWVTLALVFAETGNRAEFDQIVRRVKPMSRQRHREIIDNAIVPSDWRAPHLPPPEEKPTGKKPKGR